MIFFIFLDVFFIVILNCIFCENYKKGVFLIDFMGKMIIDIIIIICNGVGGVIVE